MSDQDEQALLKVPLGLRASLKPTFDILLGRARRQLELMHSGQAKLDELTDEQYLRRVKLEVVDDHYILLAPIPEPPQGDLVGYPSLEPGLAETGREAADDSGCTPAAMDLTAALDALLLDQPLPASVLGEDERPLSIPDSSNLETSQDVCGRVGMNAEALPIVPERKRMADDVPRHVELLAPVETKRLAVDQTLHGVERSARLLGQVREILETSADVVGDIDRLERRTGLKSGPSRSFIASRQPELVVEVDGRKVSFHALAVRTEMPSQGVVRVVVQLSQPKVESDVLRASVLEVQGVGVPNGVATLGGHDIRYVKLSDWQRGVLLILRGAGVTLHLGVREGVSTVRLVRRPALVVDPGDWEQLKQRAMDVLSAAVLPDDAGPDDAPASGEIGDEAGDPNEGDLGDDGLEAA